MSYSTERRGAWNTAKESTLDGRLVHLRRSSMSSDTTSASTSRTELSEASVTNTPRSVTTASTFDGAENEHEFIVKDDQARWRPLSTGAEAPKEEDLSLSASPACVESSFASISAENAGCLNSFVNPQSSCVAHSANTLTHLLSSGQVSSQSDLAQDGDVSTKGDITTVVTDAPRRPSANPRRTSAPKSWCKPQLQRQVARRHDFVMHLVESACQLLLLLWPEPSVSGSASSSQHRCRTAQPSLRFFVAETLKRSHSTYSILQMTLFYLCRLKVRGKIETPVSESIPAGSPRPFTHCGRRTFLAALILASKYIQDRNYSAQAWGKITNLPVKEINSNEWKLFQLLDFDLHLPLEKYHEWCGKVSECVDAAAEGKSCQWQKILHLGLAGGSGSSSSMDTETTTSLLTSDSIMSALRTAPAVGQPIFSSTMPHLCKPSGTMAPRLATSADPATLSNTTTILEGTFLPPRNLPRTTTITINRPSSPVSFTNLADITLPSSELSSFAQQYHSQSPPTFLTATHLPTPPSSLPSILSSTEEQPLESPVYEQKHATNTDGLFAGLLAERVAKLTHQHGLSPPWSDSSRMSSQEDLSLSNVRSNGSASSQESDGLPAITEMLCSGLKQHLKPAVASNVADMGQRGTKRSCSASEEDHATLATGSARRTTCAKKARSW